MSVSTATRKKNGICQPFWYLSPPFLPSDICSLENGTAFFATFILAMQISCVDSYSFIWKRTKNIFSKLWNISCCNSLFNKVILQGLHWKGSLYVGHFAQRILTPNFTSGLSNCIKWIFGLRSDKMFHCSSCNQCFQWGHALSSFKPEFWKSPKSAKLFCYS